MKDDSSWPMMPLHHLESHLDPEPDHPPGEPIGGRWILAMIAAVCGAVGLVVWGVRAS